MNYYDQEFWHRNEKLLLLWWVRKFLLAISAFCVHLFHAKQTKCLHEIRTISAIAQLITVCRTVYLLQEYITYLLGSRNESLVFYKILALYLVWYICITHTHSVAISSYLFLLYIYQNSYFSTHF